MSSDTLLPSISPSAEIASFISSAAKSCAIPFSIAEIARPIADSALITAERWRSFVSVTSSAEPIYESSYISLIRFASSSIPSPVFADIAIAPSSSNGA